MACKRDIIAGKDLLPRQFVLFFAYLAFQQTLYAPMILSGTTENTVCGNLWNMGQNMKSIEASSSCFLSSAVTLRAKSLDI